MAAKGHNGADESDDWFADVDLPPGVLESDPPSAEDDWLIQPAPARRARTELPWKKIAIVGSIVVVVLIAGLAAAGVFSSSSTPRTVPPVNVTITTSQTTTVQHHTTVVAAPATTLKPGDTGPQVRVLQRALNTLGYAVGTVDGFYGPKTEAAVKEFQQAAGLTADGVFGPQSLNAMIHRAGP
jgi:Putative peptidoglycan binding domain